MQWIMFCGLLDFALSHLEEVDLTQKQETMTIQNLTTLNQIITIV